MKQNSNIVWQLHLENNFQFYFNLENFLQANLNL